MPNAYEVLGLDGTIPHSDEAVKRSYRRLALRCHPDKNPDDPYAEEKFNLLRIAYDELLDVGKKAELDDELQRAAEKRKRFEAQDAEKKRLTTELEAKERLAQASRTKTLTEVEKMRKRNRDLIEDLRKRKEAARRADAAQRITLPKLDDLDACIEFALNVDPAVESYLIKRITEYCESAFAEIDAATSV